MEKEWFEGLLSGERMMNCHVALGEGVFLQNEKTHCVLTEHRVYQGFTGGLARDVPFRVAQLTTFEVTKSIYLRAKRSNNKDNDSIALSPLEAAICGAAAGSFSAAITNPLDRIKTLMMTDTTNAYGGSVVACASKILRDDGIGGLFAGVGPRVGYIAPSVCIFFVTYELVQQKMKKTE